MPCSICGIDGHNRRTCQRWPTLEAMRQYFVPPTLDSFPSTVAVDVSAVTPPSSFTDIRFDISYSASTRNRRPVESIIDTPDSHVMRRSLLPELDLADLSSIFSDSEPYFDSLPDLDPMFGFDAPAKRIAAPLVDCVEEPCQSTDCPICMDDLHKTDLFVSRCGHQFHGTCMVRHMRQNDTCPMCRGVLFTTTV